MNIRAELFSYFARNLWRQLWDSVTNKVNKPCDNNDNATKNSKAERIASQLATTGDKTTMATSTYTTPDSALLEEASQ